VDNRDDRDVAAPTDALAWAGGMGRSPGRWLYDELSVSQARARGEVIRRTEIDPTSGRAWLRGVQGNAPLADVMHLATDLDLLRATLIGAAEHAVDSLSASKG
jgi:hypothetical protein